MMREIEKKYVPYDLASLLKEKGFDLPCQAYFDGENQNKFTYVPYNESNSNNQTWLSNFGGKEGRGKEVHKILYNRISAPLWQDVFEWLMLKHKVFVTISRGGIPDTFCVFVSNSVNGFIFESRNDLKKFESLHEAYYEGIDLALKNLKQNEDY